MTQQRNMPVNQIDSKRNSDNLVGKIIKEVYETHVAVKALNRAGHCPQLKGHVHEIMFCDKYNANPLHILKGQHADLSQSKTDTLKDVIITKSGNVIEQAQLKDVVSDSGVRKTISQIQSGKYNQTTIFGTEETVDKLSGKVFQEIKSSGISTKTTTRIADKALGKMPTINSIISSAKAGAVTGAVFGASIEAVTSAMAVAKDIKTFRDAAVDVAKSGIKGGIVGASAAVVNSVTAGVTGSALNALTVSGIGGAIGATSVGTMAMSLTPVIAGLGMACVVGSKVSNLVEEKMQGKERLNLCLDKS